MKNPFANCRAENLKTMIDRAFSAASKAVEKEDFEGKTTEKAMQKEGLRVKTCGSTFHDDITNALNSFPDVYKISAVYSRLSDALIGNENLTRSMRTLNKTAKEIKKLQLYYLRTLETARHTYQFRTLRKEFYGRSVALLKKHKRHVELLYEAARILKKLPDFEDVPTVIIAGLPNVGKTSLLKALTGSEPEIAPYPFTTKGLMLGFTEINGKRIQVIDTPGLLDRPMKKRNPIEKQAIIALEQLASLAIFVYDPTETCGYTLEQQKNLFNDVRKQIKVPMIVVANKADLVGEREVESDIKISCTDNTGLDNLKTFISEKLKL